MSDRAERRRRAREEAQASAKDEGSLYEYTYYALAAGGTPVPLFSLYLDREPTAAEVEAFQHQWRAQQRTLVAMPKPAYVSVRKLKRFVPLSVIVPNGDGGGH